ncbi:Uncharacterised protein [Klebsiella pneumoniae]|nr:Uncharacterised protein [Klebsiella pneumoniae]
MVSQQLQRNGVEDRCNHLFHMRHLDDVHVIATYKTRILIGEDIQLTATRANFFNVGFQFFQQFVVRCNNNNRHIGIN